MASSIWSWEKIVFLEVAFSRGAWWDHTEPDMLFTAHHGRNNSLATVWLKRERQPHLRARVRYLGLFKTMPFCHEVQQQQKKRCPAVLAPHAASHLQQFRAEVWINSTFFTLSLPSENQVSWQDMSSCCDLFQVTPNDCDKASRWAWVSWLGQSF